MNLGKMMPRKTTERPSKLFFFELGSRTAVVSGEACYRRLSFHESCCSGLRFISHVMLLIYYNYEVVLIKIAFNGILLFF